MYHIVRHFLKRDTPTFENQRDSLRIANQARLEGIDTSIALIIDEVFANEGAFKKGVQQRLEHTSDILQEIRESGPINIDWEDWESGVEYYGAYSLFWQLGYYWDLFEESPHLVLQSEEQLTWWSYQVGKAALWIEDQNDELESLLDKRQSIIATAQSTSFARQHRARASDWFEEELQYPNTE